jgi:hypothetical protein
LDCRGTRRGLGRSRRGNPGRVGRRLGAGRLIVRRDIVAQAAPTADRTGECKGQRDQYPCRQPGRLHCRFLVRTRGRSKLAVWSREGAYAGSDRVGALHRARTARRGVWPDGQVAAIAPAPSARRFAVIVSFARHSYCSTRPR